MNLKQLIMRNLKTVLLASIALVIVFTSCSNDDSIPTVKEVDIINDPFLVEQNEIKKVLVDLFQSVKDGDADKLISYHHYGPKIHRFQR